MAVRNQMGRYTEEQADQNRHRDGDRQKHRDRRTRESIQEDT